MAKKIPPQGSMGDKSYVASFKARAPQGSQRDKSYVASYKARAPQGSQRDKSYVASYKAKTARDASEAGTHGQGIPHLGVHIRNGHTGNTTSH